MLRQGSGVLDKQLFRRGRELDATRQGWYGGRSVLDNGPTESKERAGNPGRRQHRLKILRRRAMLWYEIVKGSLHTDR